MEIEKRAEKFVDRVSGNQTPKRRYNLEPYTRHYQGKERIDYVNETAMGNLKNKTTKTSSSFAGLVGFIGKHKVAILKTVVAAAIFAAGVGVIKNTVDRTDSYNNATQTANVIDLPDEIFNNYDLEIKNNGSALFVDSEKGTKIGKYNGMDATDIAQSYIPKGGRTK